MNHFLVRLTSRIFSTTDSNGVFYVRIRSSIFSCFFVFFFFCKIVEVRFSFLVVEMVEVINVKYLTKLSADRCRLLNKLSFGLEKNKFEHLKCDCISNFITIQGARIICILYIGPANNMKRL